MRKALLSLAAIVVAISSALAQSPSIGSGTSPDGKVRIDIISLKRTEGDTLTLRFQVANESNASYGVTTGNIYLLDIVGRRSYSPGVTSPSCSTPVGQKSACYAIFGAPPASTQKINVQFYEKMDLITGVPISE
ncbi:MAG TPA: hypothetical protein VGU72_06415 [Beijerinckiaceae bacterium]|jgi:hypothetical protein|nr:hypothetical protein [Beijerinckiaceae bacterium]